MTTTIIGVSLSEPYIDGPCVQNDAIYLSIYLSMYHLPRVCHTLVSEICVRLEMLHIIRYIDMLTCIYNCTQLNSKDDWTTSVCRQDWSADR